MNASELAICLGRSAQDSKIQDVLNELRAGQLELDDDDGQFIAEAYDSGAEFHFSKDQVLEKVFLYGDCDEDIEPFSGGLPMGLTFASARADVRKAFGAPNTSGESCVDLGIFLQAWDEFIQSGLAIWIGYSDDESRVERVCISRPE